MSLSAILDTRITMQLRGKHMLKYFIGLISGVLLVPLGLYLFLPTKAFWQSYNYITDDISLYSDGSNVMSSYTYALGQDFGDDPTRFESETLQLVENTPVQSFASSDIERVCLQPTWYGEDYFANYYVHAFLTPDAKSKLAAQLASRDGKLFSFRLKGTELSSFILSADLLQDFGAGKLPDNVNADFEFQVPEGATITGLYYAHILNGGRDLEMCEATDSLDMIPHYQAFLENIENSRTEQQKNNDGDDDEWEQI